MNIGNRTSGELQASIADLITREAAAVERIAEKQAERAVLAPAVVMTGADRGALDAIDSAIASLQREAADIASARAGLEAARHAALVREREAERQKKVELLASYHAGADEACRNFVETAQDFATAFAKMIEYGNTLHRLYHSLDEPRPSKFYGGGLGAASDLAVAQRVSGLLSRLLVDAKCPHLPSTMMRTNQTYTAAEFVAETARVLSRYAPTRADGEAAA
jgi:hypothetical protein